MKELILFITDMLELYNKEQNKNFAWAAFGAVSFFARERAMNGDTESAKAASEMWDNLYRNLFDF